MNTIKNYIKQPSTWLGAIKIAGSAGLFAVGFIEPISGIVLSVFGVIDVLRNEKTK